MSGANRISSQRRILIDVGHPAHVHLFKNLARNYIDHGDLVLFTVRPKELEKYLLENEHLPYVEIGNNGKSILSKIWGLFSKNYRLYKIVRKFSPDIIVSHGSFYAAQVGWLLRIPSITLEDTGNREQVLLYQFFTNLILSPQALGKRFSKSHIFYNGLHEFTYIKRNGEKRSLPVDASDRLILVRFVSWNASHDISGGGLNHDQKIELIDFLKTFGNIYISSESELPDELLDYKLKSDPGVFHETLMKSSLIISDGSTTAIEGCLSGVPALYTGNCTPGVIKYLIEKGLLVAANDLVNIRSLLPGLRANDYSGKLRLKRDELYYESVDLTKLLVWIIDQYPESLKVLKEQPDFQKNFLQN